MPVRLKKNRDGRPSVTFVRPDGSSTTGRLGSGDFGPVHDLIHYAVETTLGSRHGFYGLLAAGWNIPDFETKGTGERLPDEAIAIECLVGQLGNVILQRQQLAVADFNWLVQQALVAQRPAAQVPALNEATWRLLQEQIEELLERWRTVPPGETLELEYPVTSPS